MRSGNAIGVYEYFHTDVNMFRVLIIVALVNIFISSLLHVMRNM